MIAFAVFDTPEEAIELANVSDSLSASLWTNDMYFAQRIAPLIRADEHLTVAMFSWPQAQMP